MFKFGGNCPTSLTFQLSELRKPQQGHVSSSSRASSVRLQASRLFRSPPQGQDWVLVFFIGDKDPVSGWGKIYFFATSSGMQDKGSHVVFHLHYV